MRFLMVYAPRASVHLSMCFGQRRFLRTLSLRLPPKALRSQGPGQRWQDHRREAHKRRGHHHHQPHARLQHQDHAVQEAGARPQSSLPWRPCACARPTAPARAAFGSTSGTWAARRRCARTGATTLSRPTRCCGSWTARTPRACRCGGPRTGCAPPGCRRGARCLAGPPERAVHVGKPWTDRSLSRALSGLLVALYQAAPRHQQARPPAKNRMRPCAHGAQRPRDATLRALCAGRRSVRTAQRVLHLQVKHTLQYGGGAGLPREAARPAARGEAGGRLAATLQDVFHLRV